MVRIGAVLSIAARRGIAWAWVPALLLSGQCAAGAEAKLRLTWEGLAVVAGNTVSMAMPGGAVITGTATGVESDALLVDVAKTTDPRSYPKGPLRIPRATLRVLELRGGRSVGRILGGVLGMFAGGFLATEVVHAIDGPGWGGYQHFGADVAASACAIAGGIAAGYYTGKAIDQRRTLIEIVP
jgi:hypothetical protein